jgi:maleylpyruvate isomerase
MKLFGYWRSTCTWRVRIALAHKGLDYEYVPINLVRNGGDQHTEAFRALNPMRHVPLLVLEEDGKVHRVAESVAILELLEERHPIPRLLPLDPWKRVRARQLALLVATGIQPLQNTKVQKWLHDELHDDERAWCKHWITLGLEALEALTRETAGRYSIDDELSFADLCLVPQLHFARRFDVDVERYPTLLAIEHACAALPAFKVAHADNQPDKE